MTFTICVIVLLAVSIHGGWRQYKSGMFDGPVP